MMNKTIELKRAISDIGYKTRIRRGKGTALMSYSITVIINNPPKMSLDEIHNIVYSIRNISEQIVDKYYDIYINLKDQDGRNVRPSKEDRTDIMPKDVADALQVFMEHYGLNNEEKKMGCGMNDDKLYNLICPKKNGNGNKAYLNKTIHSIREALIENEIKDFDGVTLIEIENGRAKELHIHEIVKIINPVKKTITTWEIIGDQSIVK